MTYHTLMVLLIVLGIVCLFIAVWRWLNSPHTATDKFMDQYRQRYEAVKALPIEEARRQVEMLLRDSKTFETVPASDTPENLSDFAPGLQALFQNFEKIHAVDGAIYLDRKRITPYRWDWEEGPWHETRFWHIGIWHGMNQAEVLAKPGREEIYVFFASGTCISDPDETPEERAKDVERSDDPSVYHLLLHDLRF